MVAAITTRDSQRTEHHYCEHHDPNKNNLESIDTIETKPKDYIVFAAILFFIFLSSVAVQNFLFQQDLVSWMRSFMGVFFIVFAFFKLLDLRGFAMSYVGYDILARRFTQYAYIYPFIELGLGVGYLTFPNQSILNIITFSIMTIGAIGVGKQLMKGSKIKCACLGTYVKLPLTTVSLTEDLAMGAMALVMLAQDLGVIQLL